MTTLGQQIAADMIIDNLRAIIGAALAATELIDADPANAENELEMVKRFIKEKLDAASKGVLK